MKRLAIIIIAALAAILATAPDAWARSPRSSADVRRERQEAAKGINRTKKRIEENKKKIRNRVNDLNLVVSDIDRTNGEIASLRQSIDASSNQIELVEDTINLLTTNIDRLRQSLAQSAREARSMRQGMTATAMIFSSPTFKQAMKRAGYMRQLDKSRAAKSQELRGNVEMLAQKRAALDSIRQRQQAQMASLGQHQSQLASKKKQMAGIVADLKRNEKALKKELADRQKKLTQLDRELDRIIAEEQRRAREEEERRKAQGQTKPSQEKTDNTVASASFARSKGKLMMPVAGTYSIVGRFGTSTHASLSHVTVENSGIDIQAQKGAMARAVYPGTVSSIFNLDGFHSIVMVRHGEYLTVYANVVDLKVRKGDTVKAGQNLGRVYSDPDDSDRTVLHFEVRREREKLNPLDWLAH